MSDRPYPSLERAHLADLRGALDHAYLNRTRALEDCYYGTAVAWDSGGAATARAKAGWRAGGTTPFEGFAPASGDDRAARKALFDKLHGLIWLDYALELIEENERLGKPHGELDVADPETGETSRERISAAVGRTGITIKRTRQPGIDLRGDLIAVRRP